MVSLYTNVNTDKATQAIIKLLEKSRAESQVEERVSLANLERGLKIAMKYTVFKFNDQLYRQIKGCPMGSPLSPNFANLFMQALEDDILKSCPVPIKFYKRYVDDCFVILPRGEDNENADLVLEHFNSADPDIKFTLEREKDGKLPFLDTLVQRDENGHLKVSVYRKPTHSGRGLNFESHHSPGTKRGIISTLTTRAKRITTDPADLKKECQSLEQEFVDNGFPRNLVKGTMKKCLAKNTDEKIVGDQDRTQPYMVIPYNESYDKDLRAIARRYGVRIINSTGPKLRGQLVKNQDKIPTGEQVGVVYILDCLCGLSYIGETGRKFRIRMKEHADNFKKETPNSPFIAHCTDDRGVIHKEGHGPDLRSARILQKVASYYNRRNTEALYIQACLPTDRLINRRDEAKGLNNRFWRENNLEYYRKKVFDKPKTRKDFLEP